MATMATTTTTARPSFAAVLLAAALLTLVDLASASSGGMQCRDENGFPVDWFVVFKYPDGSSYAYADPHHAHSPGLATSPFTLDSSNDGAVAHTLQQVYEGNPYEVGHVMYNDEWPDAHKHGTGGHTKGVLGFDDSGGFWLIHSVPRFPVPASDKYTGLPGDETRYGQSALCVSTSLADLDVAAKQLIVGYPWVYSQVVPSDFDDLASIKQLAAGDRGDQQTLSDTECVHSKEGNTFTTFYKSPKWGKFLYEDLVEPYFHSSFAWETWMNGINPDPSFCAKDGTGDYDYNSTNIRYLQMGWQGPDGGVGFKETQDHSKWGISTDWYDGNMVAVVCIGDINRQESQNKRGGGTTCFENLDLWTTLTRSIKQADQCDR